MGERDNPAREPLEDLDVPEGDFEEVTGGSLNAHVAKVQGEKQGASRGGAGGKGIYIDDIIIG